MVPFSAQITLTVGIVIVASQQADCKYKFGNIMYFSTILSYLLNHSKILFVNYVVFKYNVIMGIRGVCGTVDKSTGLMILLRNIMRFFHLHT